MLLTMALALALAACGPGGPGALAGSEEGTLPAADEGELPASEEGGLPAAVEAPAVDAFAFSVENMPVIDGSTATIPLIEAVYSVLLGIPRDEAAGMVDTSGTDNAYERLLCGDAEILLVYSPSPYILDMAEDAGIGLEMAPIGRDGLVFLVNAANPVDSLAAEQIVSIYTGETRNWKDVGGEDALIKAFQRPFRSGSQTMMDELVMKGAPMAETEEEYIYESMSGLVEAVAQYDNSQSAIGYNVYYFVSRMEMNENVKMLAIGGVEPSTGSIADGSYPFVSDFYAAIQEDTPEGAPARVLYDWIQSTGGQDLVRHEGYAAAR